MILLVTLCCYLLLYSWYSRIQQFLFLGILRFLVLLEEEDEDEIHYLFFFLFGILIDLDEKGQRCKHYII